MLPEDFFNKLFKFVVVRNPWDLQVSSFYHVQRERPHMMNGITDFNDYLKYKFDPARPFMYHIDITTKLQTDHILDLHGSMIVDFVGRYENLDQDVEHIRKKLVLLSWRCRAGEWQSSARKIIEATTAMNQSR